MYSNSKEQISLEEAYRRVHLVEEEEHEHCDCGGEEGEECHCNDEKCPRCHRPKNKCDCGGKSEIEEAADIAGLTGSFAERMMYFIIPALASVAVALGYKGYELAKNKINEYFKGLDEQTKKENIEYLLQQDGVKTALKHIQNLENEHRDEEVQKVINTQLKTAIEMAIKEKGTPEHLFPPAFALMQHGLGKRKNQIVPPII